MKDVEYIAIDKETEKWILGSTLCTASLVAIKKELYEEILYHIETHCIESDGTIINSELWEKLGLLKEEG